MKKIIFISMVLLSGVFFSCTDMLMEESKTKITSNWLVSTPDGLDRMVIALYDKDRSLIRNGEGDLFASLMMDSSTDLMLYRSGSGAALARLSGLDASNSNFKTVWSHHYQIIGKANEVIWNAENRLDMEDPVVKKAWGEAKVFRARAYFELYKRFERLYLNTVPTTIGNIDRVFKPSGKEAIFEVIKQDLDDAINVLDWTDMPGRFTKAVAKHIRAQVAMWEDDWTTAIEQCEDIFENPNYGLMPNTIDCFNAADLNCRENLYVYQFSSNFGGGNSVGDDGEVSGHRMSLQVTPSYNKITGCTFSAEYGGYGWGRVYPNSYLLSLYDQEKDKRYSTLFRHKWYYNDPDNLPAGKNLGDEIVPATGSEYISSLHPMTMKYFDGYTNADNVERRSSFKDIVLYRLAETYLMAAEAYYHRDGGSSPKAIEYYNKTWERAGNDHFDGPVTIDDLLDEYARECHFEGVRWPLLKRLRLLERTKIYGGDTPADDPLLKDQTSLAQMRDNFQPKHYCWPIPQSEIDFMGAENFPQNEGWL